jgi:hypothetical protein
VFVVEVGESSRDLRARLPVDLPDRPEAPSLVTDDELGERLQGR